MNSPKKQIIIYILAATIAVFLIGLFVSYQDFKTTGDELRVKKIALEEKKKKISELGSITKNLNELRMEKNKYPELLGKNKQENYIFEEFPAIITSSGLILQSITTSGGGATRGFQEFSALPLGGQNTLKEFQVNVSAVGTLPSLHSFMQSIERNYPLVAFNKLNFSQAGNMSGTITFQIVFSTYYK